MNRAATIALALLAAGAVVFVLLTERWRFSTERTVQPGTPLFVFDPGEITSFRLRNGDLSMEVEKTPGGWRLTKPLNDAAAPEIVDALFQAALESEVLDRIGASEVQDDKKLASYGVLKSTQQLDFRGDAPPALLIGKTTPDGRRAYVSFKNSKTLYLVSADLLKWLSLDPQSLRDRRLTTHTPASLERIELRQGRSILVLEQRADGWHVTKPAQFPADPLVLGEWLQKLMDARLAGIADRADARLDMEEPSGALEITLHGQTGDPVETLRFSNPGADGSRVVHLHPRAVEGRLAADTELSLDLDALRDRSLARLNPDTVDLVRIRRADGATVQWERVDGRWNVGDERVTALFNLLVRCRVEPGGEPPRPSTPAYEVSFLSRLSENTPEESAGEKPLLVLGFFRSGQGTFIQKSQSGSTETLTAAPEVLDQLRSLVEGRRRPPAPKP